MITLALESSAVTASAALDINGRISEEFVNSGLTHSTTLMPLVESLLKKEAVKPSDIDLFAVAAGPGSFTGIRIGIATVKGMAFGTGKETVGVSTLEAMAAMHFGCGYKVCALMDARLGQYYNAVFDCVNGRTRLTEDRVLKGEDIAAEISAEKKPVLLVGDGARKFADAFEGDYILPEGDEIFQRAKGVAILAREKERVLPNMLLPEYLRLPQAERELKRKQNSGRNV